jgi:hypothetical protein
MYIGIYELDSNYLPTGAPICQSTALSASATTGLKEFTLSATTTLQSNKWYGTALLSTVAIGVRGILAPAYLGGSGAAVTYGCYYGTGFSSLSSSPTMTTVLGNSYTPANIWCTR